MSNPHTSDPSILPFDAFFGRFEQRHRAGRFAYAHLAPTVPEAEVERHAHAEGHLVLITAGRYLSSADGADEVEGPGTLIYNPPGTIHRDRFRGLDGGFFTISIPAGYLHDLAGALELPDHPRRGGADAACVAQRLADHARIQSRHAQHRATSRGAEDLDLEALSLELLDRLGDQHRPRGRAIPPWLLRVRERLRQECGEPASLEELARDAGVHPVHVTRAFRAHFRCTPGEYLRRCRLNQAAALLADPRIPLAEIALTCGFYDQAHFSRAFRDAFGRSPGRYREAPIARF